jgi:hypothetical protein
MARLFITLVLLTALYPTAALAITVPDQSTDESFNKYSSADGKPFLDQVRKNVNSFNDYSVDTGVRDHARDHTRSQA